MAQMKAGATVHKLSAARTNMSAATAGHHATSSSSCRAHMVAPIQVVVCKHLPVAVDHKLPPCDVHKAAVRHANTLHALTTYTCRNNNHSKAQHSTAQHSMLNRGTPSMMVSLSMFAFERHGAVVCSNVS
jgi:hypothetical protein